MKLKFSRAYFFCNFLPPLFVIQYEHFRAAHHRRRGAAQLALETTQINMHPLRFNEFCCENHVILCAVDSLLLQRNVLNGFQFELAGLRVF